jgi:hypothetical protein
MSLLLSGCSGPSEKDKSVLDRINNQFSKKYSFEFDGDLYLWAQAKDGVVVNEEEMKSIYKDFFFEDTTATTKRNTTYVYLNVSDSSGAFIYQLAYDFTSNKFVKGKTPHY